MKRIVHSTALVIVFVICFAGLAWAESATQDEVVAKVEDAAALVKEKGVEEGAKIIGDKEGPYVWKDTYVFLMDLDGKMLAHPIKPELTEKANLLDVKDTDGKPLFVDFVEVAGTKGSGWVDYMWPKPGQDAPVAKSSYILRIEGTPYFVGAGIYK